jgi:hypothetical protein
MSNDQFCNEHNFYQVILLLFSLIFTASTACFHAMATRSSSEECAPLLESVYFLRKFRFSPTLHYRFNTELASVNHMCMRSSFMYCISISAEDRKDESEK